MYRLRRWPTRFMPASRYRQSLDAPTIPRNAPASDSLISNCRREWQPQPPGSYRVRRRSTIPCSLNAARKIFEHHVRDFRAQHPRSLVRTTRHRCTLPYGTLRHGTVPYCTAMSLIACNGEAIANTDSAKEIRRRAVMENAARLVSKIVFCCKIYTRGRVSNDDLISTKGT
jgi:hypothetical protein